VTTFESAIEGLVQLLRQFGLSAGNILTQFELALRSQLQQLGVPEVVQTMLLLAMAGVLILWSLRLFGGLFRIAALVVVLVIAAHATIPTFPH
jgi:hypothetical protein